MTFMAEDLNALEYKGNDESFALGMLSDIDDQIGSINTEIEIDKRPGKSTGNRLAVSQIMADKDRTKFASLANDIIDKQREHSGIRNNEAVGKIHRVLIEGYSRKSKEELRGRNDQNKVIVFPKENHKIGEYVNVMVNSCSTGTLIGTVI